MQRSEAQAIRREIVQFGTRENLGRMTPAQGAEYLRIRREVRVAMRAIDNERDDTRALVGGALADDHAIDGMAAKWMDEAKGALRDLEEALR